MIGTIGIDFACNDPDNGLFAGRVESIQVYSRDPLFELEARRSPAPMLTLVDDDTIRVAGKRWPIVGSNDWVGNWSWNRYHFRIDRAADFLIWLHRRRLFDLTCGDSRLYHAWRWKSGFEQFRPFLITLLAEAAS